MRGFQRLLPYLKRYKSPILIGVVCLIVANWLDIQVAVLLGDGLDVVAIDPGVLRPAQLGLLGIFLVLVPGVALGAAATRYWMRQLIIGASRDVEFEFRNDFFAHLLRLSPSFFDKYRTGDLMSRSTSDMEAIRMVIGPCIMYVANTFVVVPLTMAKMISISPLLMAVCWFPLLLLMPLVFAFKKRINVRFRRVQELMSDLSANVQESFSGIRVVKTYSREGDQSAAFDRISDQYVTANLKLAVLQSVFMPALQVIVGACLVALVGAGAVMIIHGHLTIGNLMTFFLLLSQSIWPIASFGWVMAQVERGSASMTRVVEILDQEPEVALELPAASGNGNGHAAHDWRLRGKIEMRGVTFKYPSGTHPALSNITLTIPAGTTLGVTGPIGCGKSTIAALLDRRYNPPRGTLFIDGIDILDWPVETLRRQIGIVDQEPFLFSDTIEANIGFGLDGLDGKAFEQATRRASEISQLAKDVGVFPHGYKTILGERGINLSGGQRQRTALARALARDPALMILDDALAAVDTHTEEAILRGLRDVLGERTSILISHRVSTMQLADRIIYLEDGKLIEEGTHDELLAARGRYWELAQRQKLAEEIEKTA